MLALTDAKKDFLTNCYSKESLMPFLNHTWGESQAFKKPFSVLLIDVDRFKSFNDKYGHLCGDEVLKYFSSSLRLTMGEVESAPFRFGGDEFVVVFPNKASGDAYALAVQLAKNIKSRHFLLQGRQFKMSFSGGIAAYPADGATVEEILERADKAMYFSKRGGHGRTAQYSKMRLKKIQTLLFTILIAGLCVVTLLFGRNIVKFRLKTPYLKTPFKMINAGQITTSPLQDKELDNVYLKSGGIIRGKLIREDPDEVELKLKLDRGEGVMILRRSDIVNIEKAQKSNPNTSLK